MQHVLIILSLLACLAWNTVRAASTSATAELARREIDLLKLRQTQLRQQLDHEKISRIVYQTALEVAAIRGFEVFDVVDYRPLTEERLDEILEASISKQYPGASLRHYVWLNQLFLALPRGIDMLEYMKELTDEQVAGLYDPLSKHLFVRTDFKLDGPLGRMILAHEICHALQDQNSPLTELGVDDPSDSDRAMAVLSIAEGDATLLMSEHMSRFGNPFGLLSDLPKLMSMDQEKLNNAPIAIQKSMLFPYLDGMQFFMQLAGRTRQHPQRNLPAVAAVGDRSDWRQEVFADPPETTEQIIHPEKYLAREIGKKLDLPETAWDGLMTSTTSSIGEFGVSLMLEPLIGASRARGAAAGWDGDKILVGEVRHDDKRTTAPMRIEWLTQWDTPRDADEFAEALADGMTMRYAGTLRWNGKPAGEIAPTLDTRQGRSRKSEFTIERPAPQQVRFHGAWRELP